MTSVHPGPHFVEFSTEETRQSVPRRFEKQVLRYGERIALQTESIQLSYRNFNESANRLARLIRRHSSDEHPVAILMEHDAPAIIAVFAALKAAKTFTLLDPALPHVRIRQILNDAGSSMIITGDQNAAAARELLQGTGYLLNVDRCDSDSDAGNLNLEILPDSVSHILYTSGSTGKPKGVMRTHRNDLQNIRNRTNSFRIDRDDRSTLLGSFSTGQGIADIYAALLNGAALFPRNLKREGILGLVEWLIREKITIYHSSATFFRHFMSEVEANVVFPDVRIVNVGGEPVTRRDVELYKAHFVDNCLLVNELSCSEASTFAQFFVDKNTMIDGTVPVGYPVEGKDVWILDDGGSPLVTGKGEIAISSRFLSPGYWKQPDLTELAFVPDPNCQESRIYRTGDLGRKLPDGCLEYLGRKDEQVKIRGYRVECFEVEVALLSNPFVRQVVVTHRQDVRNESFLIAYIVPAKNMTLSAGTLRADLARRLPDYMIPSAFVLLDSLPLTATGKIDRAALPESEPAGDDSEEPGESARNEIEHSIAGICREIVNRTNIGIRDNLFDSGAHSLSAMQIVSRIMRTFGVNVPLKCFYEAPTIAGLSELVANSKAAEGASGVEAAGPALLKRQIPLSFAQERLWFMEQLEPARPTYNICQAHCLEGPLNVNALEESVNTVVARHEALRTSFEVENGQPFQSAAPSLRVPLVTSDVRSSAGARNIAEGLRVAQKEATRRFDLSQAPLLRTRLLRVSDDEHFFIITAHQLVCDGWSMRIFVTELWTAYDAIIRGRSPDLHNLPAQYSDFAIWQRQLYEENRLVPQIEFWQKQLNGRLPVVALPTDWPRPAVESFRGARVPFDLPETLTSLLNEMSRQQGVTLFITLMACFNTLVYRYTGQEDSVIGFPVADRSWGAAMGLIGFFVNTLVARTFIPVEATFKELLYRVRDVCQDAYANQDLPFEKLVEILRPSRDLSRHPIVQAIFTFQNMPAPESLPHELSSTLINIDNGTSKVDLTLSLAERENQLTGFLEYSTDLFRADTIERLAGHFRVLVEAVVADPEQPIATLPMLPEDERHRILVEWNNTVADYPKHKCIHHLFEEQVERTPEAVALEFEDQQITYRELNCRANRLAHYLIALGIGPEELVGICIERSIEMVVGLLGILKAGGAYVPLDPTYPAARLHFILEDTQVSVLLTQQRLIEDRRWGSGDGHSHSSIFDPQLQTICLDSAVVAQQSYENPASPVGAEDLAYVIYTSGSTGRPKGVQVSHRSVVNCLCSVGKHIGLTERDVWYAVTTIAFDIAGLEIYLPLAAGAKIVLGNPEESRDGRLMSSRLRESGATVMQATPSTWRLLIEGGWTGCANFKLLSGGEALSRDLAQALLMRGEVWNFYGPTETTIWSTVHKLEPGDGAVPIGQPLANTRIYILDAYLQPVPIGVHGDLYIGGDGLARGYWNRPELTAESFVPDPFSSSINSRLYRTGDRARYRADGTIEFLGRTDNQVKIRGHRIESGEIESALLQHPSVKECVVVARELDTTGEKELIGYIVGTEVSVGELHRFLRERLPEYMLPSSFVFLNHLPLTSNGKLDRDALPSPDGERPRLSHEFVAPRSELEELIAQILREVLKQDTIGIYDNFFELGGHSLLAMRVVARLNSAFQVDLALRKLFERPTVAGLAAETETLRRSNAGTVIAPIVAVARTQALPLSFSQRRLWFLQKVDPNLTSYNIPAAFHIRGDLDPTALEQALNQVVARHEVLRSYITEIDGRPLQQSKPELRIDLPVIDLRHLPIKKAEAEAKRLCEVDARSLYDLTNSPLLRVSLVKIPTDQHFLILNFHHIVADGSSLAIFYRELAHFYDASGTGNRATLPALPVQYGDFAAWQQEWLTSDAFNVQIAYWKRQLAELPATLELPADFARPLQLSHRGHRVSRVLPDASTAALKTFGKQNGATTFMTLFAVFNMLLSRMTGQEDIIIGSTIAGRTRSETEGLIGFFINALPLRIDLSGDPSFSQLLGRVRNVCLDAYAHQDTPFEKIVEELRPIRIPGHNPIFDILFNVADISERALGLPGCEIVKVASPPQEAKFDLVLHAPEIDGRIELAAVYNTALFREERISLLLEQWAALLYQALTSPDRPISQFSLVTESSRAVLPDPTQILEDKWEGAIHDILARQAWRSPESPAVIDPPESWTYGEIDETANRLANALTSTGILPNDTVAIYAERNASLVIAIFGVLKAGAAFLILDPAYPVARTMEYLRIAQPKGWLDLSKTGAADELASYLDAVDLPCRMNIPDFKSELLEKLSAFARSTSRVRVSADDPAYIAFTSGSTGEPKGVICRHGPITHFLPWQKEAFQLSANDRFAMLSGLAYSHLHRDLFTAIDLGAAIYIPSPSEARSPDQLVHWLEQNAITVLHLTPALGQLLLMDAKTQLPSVRRVYFGGDVFTNDYVRRMHELVPNATIGSFYGATETQRAVGYYEITDPRDLSDRAVPLGKGIRDVQLLVLSRSRQLAGVGELGEIFVRSPHLAAGYIGDAEGTHRMFVTNPFTNRPNDRLYRTGELGRYLSDGNVEWAGRKDRRINIRGFRVELEEVESVLKQHPAVKDVAVVVQEITHTESEAFTPPKTQSDNRKSKVENRKSDESESGSSDNPKPVLSKVEGSKIQNLKSDPRLVAYVVSSEGSSQSLSDMLYSYLSSRLPEYMLPAHFIVLNSLPLTPNGKVDYAALPRLQLPDHPVALGPRNEIELKLQAIFAEVLGRSDIGIDDDFFRLGGHSLLAARAAARIANAFEGLSLGLSAFLEAPTVKALAVKIAAAFSAGQTNRESGKDEREEFEL